MTWGRQQYGGKQWLWKLWDETESSSAVAGFFCCCRCCFFSRDKIDSRVHLLLWMGPKTTMCGEARSLWGNVAHRRRQQSVIGRRLATAASSGFKGTDQRHRTECSVEYEQSKKSAELSENVFRSHDSHHINLLSIAREMSISSIFCAIFSLRALIEIEPAKLSIAFGSIVDIWMGSLVEWGREERKKVPKKCDDWGNGPSREWDEVKIARK